MSPTSVPIMGAMGLALSLVLSGCAGSCRPISHLAEATIRFSTEVERDALAQHLNMTGWSLRSDMDNAGYVFAERAWNSSVHPTMMAWPHPVIVSISSMPVASVAQAQENLTEVVAYVQADLATFLNKSPQEIDWHPYDYQHCGPV